MIFRLRFQSAGGHIHCRLFQATAAGHTWEKNGDLVFDEPGWRAFSKLMWAAIELLPEDEREKAVEILQAGRNSTGEIGEKRRYHAPMKVFIVVDTHDKDTKEIVAVCADVRDAEALVASVIYTNSQGTVVRPYWIEEHDMVEHVEPS